MEEKFLHSLESIPLSEIVKDEYRNYQIYTLMDRAIPYLTDGLKPCQRRILYTLWKNSSKGLIKVSSATGLVLTLHPHGPASIESSIVNMAQDFTFTNNYPLIEKKGYFGERMEPVPAASRYIECKISKIAELLLFDDMQQVEMIPNFDEKVMEPTSFKPKLPLMLLNGAEGIGTGFSSVIPSFHHKEIIDSMINMVLKGRPKQLTPYFHYYSGQLDIDEKGRIFTSTSFKEEDGRVFMTELPRGYDAQRVYRHLGKFIETDYLKDFIDSSVDNDILIELIFKRGAVPPIEEIEKNIGVKVSIVPNYTLITERGVKVLETPEEIIRIFTLQRLEIVKRRYEIWANEAEERISKNEEIIRFILEKHYAHAVKCQNRKEFTDYLSKNKFKFTDYLSELPIYRLTEEEVNKRELFVKEDQKKLKEYKKIAKSEALVKEKLYEELVDIKEKLTVIIKDRDANRKKLFKKLGKKK